MSAFRPEDLDSLLAQSDWLRRLALGLVRDPSAAEDLVQQTRIAAWAHAPLTGAADLRAWMHVVARNFARRARRDGALRETHERRGARDEHVEGPDEIAARVELQRRLAEALLALEEPFRSALVLRYLDGLSTIQVAERLGVSHDAARQRISRGLAKLRERLDRGNERGRSGWMCALVPFVHAPERPLIGGLVLMGSKAKFSIAALVLSLGLGLWLWNADLAPASPEPGAAAPISPAHLSGAERNPEPVTLDPSGVDARAPVAAAVSQAEAAALASANLLRGIVLDPDDRPVEGARVVASSSLAYDYQTLDVDLAKRVELAGETHSDAAGRFELALDPARSYLVSVHKPEYAEASFGRRRCGESMTARLAYGAALEGLVTQGETKQPVAGARVRCFLVGNDSPDGARFERLAETDASGMFRFESLPPRKLGLEAQVVGLPSSGWIGVQPEAGKTIRQDVHLVAKAWVRGVVRDARTRTPIAGALLSTSWTMTNPCRADAWGEFALPLDGLFWRELFVRAPGYGFRGFEMPESTVETGASGVELKLEPARGVRGRVVDARGKPVGDAYVAACAADHYGGQRHDWIAGLSDADGRYEFADLRPDLQHSLFVRAAGFGSVVYEFPAAELQQALLELPDVVLHAGGSISGTVVDENDRPVVELAVVLRGTNADRGLWDDRETGFLDFYVGTREGRTDDSGRFSFGELAAGEYQVDLLLDSHRAESKHTVSLGASEHRTDLRLVLESGLTMSGLVHDRAGRPARGVYVSIEPTEPGERQDYDVQTGDDGRFLARGVAPGAYRIQLWPPPPNDETPDAPFHVHTVIGGVTADGRELDLVITDGVWLTGLVVEADGAPLAGAKVSARKSGQEYGETDVTDAAGRFRLGVERDQPLLVEAKRPIPGSGPNAPASFEADATRWGRVSGAFAGVGELTITMPLR